MPKQPKRPKTTPRPVREGFSSTRSPAIPARFINTSGGDGRIFKPDVKLDQSQVRDLRGKTELRGRTLIRRSVRNFRG